MDGKPRRGRGEGSVTQVRKKGVDGARSNLWLGKVTLSPGVRKSVYGPTREECVRAMRQALTKSEKGEPLGDARVTVAGHVDEWLASAKPTLRPSTYRRYEQLLRIHAKPHIGTVKLRALTPAALRKLYARLQEPDASGKGGLSPRTVGHVHRALHAALEQAARDGIVARNVAALVSPPRVPSSEVEALDAEQATRLVAAAEGDRLHALYVLAVTSGMREGELLGLRWDDVDLDAGTLRVRRTLAEVRKGEPQYQEPKTTQSRREIPLTRGAIAALREHRQRQREERMAATSWKNADLVFPDKAGREMHGSNFYRDSWRPLRAKAELPGNFTFHGLRHTAASHMLAAGVPVATVTAMLGHAKPEITMRLYAHAIPGSLQLAADAMDRMLAGSGTA